MVILSLVSSIIHLYNNTKKLSMDSFFCAQILRSLTLNPLPKPLDLFLGLPHTGYIAAFAAYIHYQGEVEVPCGRKRKLRKIATHKRKKKLRKNRHKNK